MNCEYWIWCDMVHVNAAKLSFVWVIFAFLAHNLYELKSILKHESIESKSENAMVHDIVPKCENKSEYEDITVSQKEDEPDFRIHARALYKVALNYH